jgi:kumamolisin
MRIAAASAVVVGLLTSVPVFAKPMEVVLRLQEKVSFAELANNVTDPTSPRYRQFYTPAEIRDLAGPTGSEYQAFLANLAKEGLTVVRESPTHLQVTVSAEPEVYEKTFNARLASLDGKTHSLISQIRIPEPLSLIASVSGLDNTRRLHPRLKLRAGTQAAHDTGVSPEQIRKLYGFDALYAKGLSGAGQHIAIATYDNFYIDDVNAYYTRHNMNPKPTVDQVKFNGEPQYSDQLSDVETAIDAQFSGALAPQVQIHVFTSAQNSDAGELAMFTAILDDNRAKVANYSWGGCESDLTAQHKSDMDTVFKRAVAQGVNIMVASGDSGSYCPQQTTTVMADWPAAHPSVVAVGGTTLDTTAASLSETAWSYDSSSGGGSGGGISTVWELPSWQSGLKAPFVKRSYPDVAFNANPASGQAGYVRITPFGTHADAPVDFVLGGTSIAAPQWSGFLALIGEARAKAGKAPLGFLNPVIYAMTPGDQTTAFDPITSGQNGAYQAGPGWNAVCGWGGLRADVLGPYLTSN